MSMTIRKVEKGDYAIGDNDVAYNTPHMVTMAKDYYVAIFELTRGQYARIVNDDKTSTDATSIKARSPLTWMEARGTSGSAANVTSSSVLGMLSAKTTDLPGLFDLPTLSMLEVAARAGVSTKYIGGTTTDNQNGVWGWLSGNTIRDVGLLKPNNWGFYDILGNCWEQPRDTWNTGDLASLQTDGQNPISTGDSAYSCFCFGSCDNSSYTALSSRCKNSKNHNGNVGIRPSYIVQ